ncbi:protein-disulfide reductase DsbD [Sulfurimonas sp. SWIR-19]|uniref:protein-disulfide reductase DsbD family protein n=1 Tax=Sulfurimonas sp. SWIR-19 TaxID=2878390 RepID=UPI001CF2D6B7|nr:protein-disulfide reductase DsbD [Sulfurimonas sp. SWIR-19]UCM99981.1 protein-disulfide reductase DsbD [Sulfurimonas sp. SWIR-19]
MKKQNITTILFLLGVFSLPLFAKGDILSIQSTLSILGGAFIAGILLTFTPCVLPMIPILSSVIAGEGKKISKLKALELSLAYVLGTAVTYGAMGALAGATGDQLQSYFQNTWAISAMSLLFVLMALAMFGLFTLQLPSSLQSRLNGTTHNLKGGKFFAVFLLGLVSALVLGACVSPVLISFLSVAIATSDPLLGAQTMFALALGMGIPLLLMGMGIGYLLPKAGAWMDGIKYFFGIILLGVAIYLFAELQLVPSLILWGAYFVGIAVYLGALNFNEDKFSSWQKFQKMLAVFLFIWGTISFIGAAKGNVNFLLPLQEQAHAIMTAAAQKNTLKEAKLPFEKISNLKELTSKREEALRKHKPIVIYFHAEHCRVCEKLKNTTLKDAKIRKILKSSYIPLMVDMTNKSDKDANAIKAKLKVFGPPAFIIIDADGEVLEDDIAYGYQSAKNLFDMLDMNTAD